MKIVKAEVKLTEVQYLLLKTIAQITNKTPEQTLYVIVREGLFTKAKEEALFKSSNFEILVNEIKRQLGFVVGWNPHLKDNIMEAEMFDKDMREMEGRED